MNKIEAKLTNVPETLLIPLRARYNETLLKNGIIKDPKSIEILDRIEYDFSGKKEVSISSQKGVAVRTEILDELTIDFICKHHNSVIVNLGCGLDTRWHRLKTENVLWFDLDVEEVIALREHFFTETDTFKFIRKSVFDFSWMELIPRNRPTLFLAEGLLMYFTEEEVKSIFGAMAQHFPGAEIAFEAMAPFVARNSDKHADVKKYKAVFKWGIRTGKEIENWGVGAHFIEEFYYNRHPDKMPFLIKIMYMIPAFKRSMMIIHLKFGK